MSTIMGVDYGSRRIGLAIADKQLKVVKPLAVISNDKYTMLNLSSYCDRYQVERIVIGLPRNLEGEETAQSLEVRQFASRITNGLSLPVELQDETLTSVEAKKTFPVKKSPQIKQTFDSFAAAVILKDYLEKP